MALDLRIVRSQCKPKPRVRHSTPPRYPEVTVLDYRMPPFSKPYYFPTGLQFSNSRLLLKAYKTVSQEQYPGEPEAERRDENSTLEEFESSGTAGTAITNRKHSPTPSRENTVL